MLVIQIDITNACTKRCSNCTRFCGHQAKPFFMDLETFRKAVDSLKEFPGVIGMMGGEPTLHPQFAAFAGYLRETIGHDEPDKSCYAPTPAFVEHVLRHVFDFRRNNRRGLWSSISSKYAEHFEIIQDTFGVQCLNDHSSPSMHTTLMATRAELGIDDEAWIKLRDNCWVQNNWSAAITPKGAFFCEVAAAMDATLQGPGGWPIEPGWWRRTPAEFGDQLRWCEMCSACLPVPKRNANEEVDDASPAWVERLKALRSPKLNRGLVNVFDPAAYRPSEHAVTSGEQPYLDANDKRIGAGQQILVPKTVVAVADVDDAMPVEALRQTIAGYAGAFGAQPLVVSGAPAHHALAAELGVVSIDRAGVSGVDLFSRVRAAADETAWLLLMHGQLAADDLVAMLRSHVFNPGCFYTLRNVMGRPAFEVEFLSLRASALADGGDFFALKQRYAERKVQVATAPSTGPVAAPAVHNVAPMRVAVITPYYKESDEILMQCHESVAMQRHPATHFMIADGHPKALVAGWPVEHIVLPRAHADNGNTPRGIGSTSAISQGFDAIAYLDADNWYRPDHLEKLIEAQRSTGAAICTCNRTMHRPDGSVLYWDLESNGVQFVDTSCLFLTERAFRMVALWGMMPKKLSPVCDRIFWMAICASRLPRAHLRYASVAFRTRYADHYTFAGEEPPAGAVTGEEFGRPTVWWNSQSPTFRNEWNRYFATGGWKP
jgi:hypothetical protein